MRAAVREWLARVRTVFRPAREDRDLEEELRVHVEMAKEDARHRAESPEDAESAARGALLRAGGVAQAMEALRDQRGVPWLEGFARDLRHGSRMLARSPGFTLVAIATLSAALGLCLTLFRVVNAYVIRSLPYPGASRLYSVSFGTPGQSLPRGLDGVDWSALDDVVEHRLAWDLDMFFLLGGDHPEAVRGAWISPGFLQALGARVERGRALGASDFSTTGPAPVLISHRLWAGRFSGDPNIVGRSIRAYVSDRPDEPETLTIAGVLSGDFWHVNPYTDVLAPLRAPAHPYMVKLREGVDPRSASDRLTELVRSAIASVPDGWRADLVSVHARYVKEMRPLLGAVGAAASMVLLIACANVAVLLLVRALRRRSEMAIRLALGASRARLARLLALEALVLATAAAALGLAASSLISYGLAPTLEHHLGRRLPGGVPALASDGSVVWAAIASGAIVALVLTAASLSALWRVPMGPAESGGRSASSGPGTRRTRSVLVACEIAGALALLVGSGLTVETTLRLLRLDLGFRPAGVVTASVGLRQRSYPDAARRADFYERFLRRLDERGDGGPAALSDHWVLQSVRPRPVESAGEARVAAEAAVLGVSAGYFATLGIEILDGGTFASQDRVGGEAVVVVSESLARRLWPRARAVGQRLLVADPHREGAVAADARPHLVVGVVRDVRQVDTDDGQVRPDTHALDAYVALLQNPGRFAYVYAPHPSTTSVRAAEEAIREGVAELDPEAAMGSARTLEAALDEVLARPRRMAWLFSGFAAFSVLLALLGAYGAVAYAVGQREREIGIRMAVGADRPAVTRLFVREGAPLLAWGLAAGLLASILLGRALQSQLFGVSPAEPGVLAVLTAAFASCGWLALWWPARRAATVDPARVLRTE